MDNCENGTEEWKEKREIAAVLTGHSEKNREDTHYYYVPSTQYSYLLNRDKEVLCLIIYPFSLSRLDSQGVLDKFTADNGNCHHSVVTSSDGCLFLLRTSEEAGLYRYDETEPFTVFHCKRPDRALLSGSGKYVLLFDEDFGFDAHAKGSVVRVSDKQELCNVTSRYPVRFVGDRFITCFLNNDTAFRIYDPEDLSSYIDLKPDKSIIGSEVLEKYFSAEKRHGQLSYILGNKGLFFGVLISKSILVIWDVQTGKMLRCFSDLSLLVKFGEIIGFGGKSEEFLVFEKGMLHWKSNVELCRTEKIYCTGYEHYVMKPNDRTRWFLIPYPEFGSERKYLDVCRIRDFKTSLQEQIRADALMGQARELMDREDYVAAKKPLFDAYLLMNVKQRDKWVNAYRRFASHAKKRSVSHFLTLMQMRFDSRISSGAFCADSDMVVILTEDGQSHRFFVSDDHAIKPCPFLVRTQTDWRFGKKPESNNYFYYGKALFDRNVTKIFRDSCVVNSVEENPCTDMLEVDLDFVLLSDDIKTQEETCVNKHRYSGIDERQFQMLAAVSPDGSSTFCDYQATSGGRICTQSLKEQRISDGKTVNHDDWFSLGSLSDFCVGGSRDAEWDFGYDIISSDGDMAAVLLDEYTVSICLLIRDCEPASFTDDVREAEKVMRICLALNPEPSEDDIDGLILELQKRNLGYLRPDSIRKAVNKVKLSLKENSGERVLSKPLYCPAPPSQAEVMPSDAPEITSAPAITPAPEIISAPETQNKKAFLRGFLAKKSDWKTGNNMEISSTLSNDFSKQMLLKKTSMTYASLEDAKKRENDAISNERIQNGDMILDTYEVTSDAISGGMGSIWRVHHQSWNTDLAMKRPQPRFFAEGGEGRKEQFIKECENWINLGLHPNIVPLLTLLHLCDLPNRRKKNMRPSEPLYHKCLSF